MNDMSRTRGQDARQATHRELDEVSAGLIAEFADRVLAGTVLRCVAQAREELARAGVSAGLAVAAEAMARIRLAALVTAHGGYG